MPDNLMVGTPRQSKKLAGTSVLLGVLAILFSFPVWFLGVLGLLSGALGFYFGKLAHERIAIGDAGGPGLASAGKAVSAIGMLLVVLWWILMISGAAFTWMW